MKEATFGQAPQTFGQQLRAAMGTMKQEELAELTGLSQSMISLLVNDKTKPGYDTLVTLETALPELRKIRHAA